MTHLGFIGLFAILIAIGTMEGALASGKQKLEDQHDESSHAHKVGKNLGSAAKNIEHAYKEAIVKPSKELKKGVKEGEKAEKGSTE